MARGAWLFGEGSISPWKRDSGIVKSLVSNTIGNPHCPVLFWSSPYLLWKPRCKMNLQFDSYSCQLQGDCCRHRWDTSQCESLHDRKKILRGYFMTWAAVRAHSLEGPVWISHLQCFGLKMLNLTIDISQQKFSQFLFLLWFKLYKDIQKWMRYSSTLRTSQFGWLRGGLYKLGLK